MVILITTEIKLVVVWLKDNFTTTVNGDQLVFWDVIGLNLASVDEDYSVQIQWNPGINFSNAGWAKIKNRDSLIQLYPSLLEISANSDSGSLFFPPYLAAFKSLQLFFCTVR